MKIAIIAALAAIALSGCAASPDYMHQADQGITINSAPGAHCSGIRDGVQLFAATAGDTVTVSKSKSAIMVTCSQGAARTTITVEPSMDSLSMSPLWDMANGSFHKYPAAVFVDLGGAK